MPAVPRFRWRRLLRASVLILLLAVALPGYALLNSIHNLQVMPTSLTVPPSADNPAAPLSVYAELTGLDPVRESVQIRLSPAPERGLRGPRPLTPDRALILHVGDGTNLRDMPFEANQTMPSFVQEFDLADDTVNSYPFDHYSLTMSINAFEGSVTHGGDPPAIPVRLTIWEALPGWIFVNQPQPSASDGGQVVLISARRSGASRYLAVAMYGAMAVIGCAALAIGSLVFLGVRRIEATLVSALGAMVFALPALRNVMPDAPPLGVGMDILVFLWAELAVVIGLALFVWSWARAGPSP